MAFDRLYRVTLKSSLNNLRKFFTIFFGIYIIVICIFESIEVYYSDCYIKMCSLIFILGVHMAICIFLQISFYTVLIIKMCLVKRKINNSKYDTIKKSIKATKVVVTLSFLSIIFFLPFIIEALTKSFQDISLVSFFILNSNVVSTPFTFLLCNSDFRDFIKMPFKKFCPTPSVGIQ